MKRNIDQIICIIFAFVVAIPVTSYASLANNLRKYISLEQGWSNKVTHIVSSNIDAIKSVVDGGIRLEPDKTQKGISVGIVRHEEINKLSEKSKSRRIKSVLSSLSNNALAISPDLILIDDKFVAEIVVRAFGDMTAFVGVLTEAVNIDQGKSIYTAEEAMRRAEYSEGIQDILSLRLLRNSRTSEAPEWTPSALLEPLDDALRELGLAQYFDLVLAPVLLHEIGHLQHKETGFFLDWVREQIEKRRAESILENELRADRYAHNKIKMLLKKSGARIILICMRRMSELRQLCPQRNICAT